MRTAILAVLAAARLAAAHFGMEYPAWRADTLSDEETYDQWVYPCAKVPNGVGNRTDWPISGGSISLDLHHKWTYLFINLGLGSNATAFSVPLTPELVNVTGNGTYCIPVLPVPIDAGVKDGDNATIQVVTSGASGSALYNCADITFRESAKLLEGDKCKNSTGITATVGQVSADHAQTNATEGSSDKSAAGPGPRATALTTMAGLAVAFALGMGL